jgi:hypothetical protein
VTEFETYIGLGYVVHMLKGTWNYEAGDVQRFGGFKQTSLKRWFERDILMSSSRVIQNCMKHGKLHKM